MNTLRSYQLKTATWQILLFSVLFMSLNAQANDVIQTKILDSLVFASELEAIKAMRQHCLAESSHDDAEHMGAILQGQDGSFQVTHGKGEPKQSLVQFSIRRSPSHKTVALWHTHGAPGRRTERFSVADSEAVRATGLPFYLIAPSGKIAVLEIAEKGKSNNRATTEGSAWRKAFRISNGLALYRLQ